MMNSTHTSKLFIFLAVLLLTSIVSGASFSDSSSISRTTYQAPPSFQTYYGTEGRASTYWPILENRDQCEAREDILLHVAPGGCQPAVVRSDLLAEQNVPVFCQINALSLNPLVDIKELQAIRFTGSYPSSIVGAGFHPAQAAIRTRDKLLGDPLINNVGYVVLVLKKQEQEKLLPNFVNVTLQAQLEYEAGNAFGIGRAEFILEPVSEANWEEEKIRQSFWRGQYYIRLDHADSNRATISLYHGEQKITSTSVERGTPSKTIYVPGFYCRAGVQIVYDGFVSSQKKARIDISDGTTTDSLDVYEGSRIMNNRCTVTRISTSGIPDSGNVSISCDGGQRFILSLKPRIDQLMGALKDAANKPVTPVFENDYWTVTLYDGVYGIKGASGDGNLYFKKSNSDAWVRAPVGRTTEEKLRQSIIQEALEYYAALSTQERTKLSVQGGALKDRILTPAESETAFTSAVSAYEQVSKSYPLEKPTDGTAYGQQSLEEAIQLAQIGGIVKEQTLARLLEEIVALYPNAPSNYLTQLRTLYSRDNARASVSVDVGNSFKTITLSSISTPLDNSGAVFSFAGSAQTMRIPLGENRTLKSLHVSGNLENVYLDEVIDEDRVRIRYECTSATGTGIGTLRSGSLTLSLRDSAVEVCTGSRIKVERIDLKEVAKVRLLPWVKGTKSETNLTVAVGIEKRAIQLSTDKTEQRILTLNKSIQDWEQINKNLGNIVSGLKAACFVTAATLTAKNFISGTDGSSLARQQTMQGENGWNNQCKKLIEAGTYSTPTECFNANKAAIEQEVKQRTTVITNVNKDIASIESAAGVKSGSFASGYTVDTIEAEKAFIAKLKSEYPSDPFVMNLKDPTRDSPTPYSYADLRDWYTNKQLEAQGITSATLEKTKIEQRVNDQRRNIADLEVNKNKPGLEKYSFYTQAQQRELEGKLLPVVHESGVTTIGGLALSSASSVSVDASATHATIVSGKVVGSGAGTPSENNYYLVVGNKPNGGNTLIPSAVYTYQTDSSGAVVLSTAPARVASNPLNFYADNNIKSLKDGGNDFTANQISASDRTVRYFETGPDKGLPAVVPFDVANGWYVRVKSNLNLGNQIAAYDSSGLPKTWWICNVGANKGIDTTDECQQIVSGVNSGVSVLGLDDRQSQRLIEQSRKALLDAAAQKNNKLIRINGQDLYQGAPATQFDNVGCQDFMSASDCKLLFNVCDPVICPATRCDFGGQYPVSDVIQSGIIGSTLLCLPNYKEGIKIPVCLTGIHAGLDSYISVLKSHRDCLQTSLSSGKMTGICDEIYSIYACEFFWRQVAPLANILLPKLVEFAYGGGQGARGGGEYLTVMGAWQNTQKSIDYFTQTYAVNSLRAFQLRSTDDIGSQFCKGFVSVKGPKSVKSLVAPDSPPQFFATFDTIKFSDATVPATAQYKVYYHIFAGKDSGVYYSVYLKNPPESSYYYNTPFITVATGFITQGQSADETKDFTAPEGYRELCVRINDVEECGFKQVTSDMGLNYLRDQYVADELKDTTITSEQSCISGSTRIGSLLNPNLQAGGEETIGPRIYERGVVRVCGTRNPGSSTDPTRYVEVGYCSDKSIKCWLDKQSVSNAISDSNIGVKNQTLNELEQYQKARLVGQGVILSDVAANDALYNITRSVELFAAQMATETNGAKATTAARALLNSIDARFGGSLEQLTLNHHKAQVLYYKAKILGIVSRVYLRGTLTQLIAQQGYAGGSDTDTSGTTPLPSGTQSDTEANVNTPTSNSYTLESEQIFLNGEAITVEYVTLNSVTLPLYLFGGKVWMTDGSGESSIGTYSTSGTIEIDFSAFNAVQSRGSIISPGLEAHLEAINGVRYDSLKKVVVSTPTTTTPSTTTPSTTTTAALLPLGLAYYDGYDDFFVFRWNNDHVEVKGKISWAALGFGLPIGKDVSAWVTDPNEIVGFKEGSVGTNIDAIYAYERSDVIGILGAPTWNDAVFAITKAAIAPKIDSAVFFPADTSTDEGLFDDSDKLDVATYNDVKQKLGL